MVRRRWRDAIILATAIGVAMIIATGFCYAMYGREFLFQTFIFHFMKGRTDLLSVMAYPLAILDIQLPLFVIGCIAARREVRTNSGLMLVLAMVAAEYLFFGILSPTSWAHNYLEALPFITIIGGIGVDWMIGQAQVRIERFATLAWGWPDARFSSSFHFVDRAAARMKTGCRVRFMDSDSFRAKRFRASAPRYTMRAAPTRTSSRRRSSPSRPIGAR